MRHGQSSGQSTGTLQREAGLIRPLERTDLAQVSELYDASYGLAKTGELERRAKFFEKLFFENPWRDERLCSLVYEKADGRLAAFAGVDVRRMVLHGKRLTVVVGGPLWARLNEGQSSAGFMLLSRVLQGPQDLTIVGANKRVLGLWEFLGGRDNWFSGCRWLRPIRPVRFLLSRVGRESWAAPIQSIGQPLARAADALLQLLPKNRYRMEDTATDDEPLDIEEIVDQLPLIMASRSLRPDYQPSFLRWLLECAGGPGNDGALMSAMVRSRGQKLIGWYVYYLFPDGFAQVVQIGTQPSDAGTVIQNLISHAAKRGAVALLGRLDGSVAGACSGRGYVHPYRYPSLLVHSRDRQIMAAAQSADAFLSRLDNEWLHGMLRHPSYGVPNYPR